MCKVLVVDDNPVNMELATAVLTQGGHVVLQAGNAAAGIRIALESLPDLIFMDIQLPGMDGLEATRQIKANPITQHIPIYALTAFAMKGDEDRFRQAGCDGYLAKPLKYKDLLTVAQTVVNPPSAIE